MAPKDPSKMQIQISFSTSLSKKSVILSSCMSNAFKLNEPEMERTNILSLTILYKSLTNA